MKKLIIFLFLIISFLTPKYVLSLSYDLNYVFSGSIYTDPPYARVEIKAISDGVQFTLYNLTPGTESGSSKLTEFYFNYKGSNTLSWTSPTGWNLSYESNGKQADGDGKFDFELDSAQGNIYVAVGTPLVFEIYGDNNPDNFYDLSVTGGGEGIYHFAAHMQALLNPKGGSAWVGDRISVPEPSLLLLLGLGLTAVGIGTRWMRRK